MLAAGLAVFCIPLAIAFFSGWMGGVVYMLLLPWSAISLAYLTNFNRQHSSKTKGQNTNFHIKQFFLILVLVLAVFSFTVSPFTKWNAVSTLFQIPTEELCTLKFMAEYVPETLAKTVIGGVGIGHGGTGYIMSDTIRFIYADRTDLFVDSIAPVIINLDSEEAVKYVYQYDIVAFSGYALTLNSKYYTEIPVKDQINYILQSLDVNASYSLVYSSKWPYYIMVKT
jgi:hypothetical protein